jgi:hypothetical protein
MSGGKFSLSEIEELAKSWYDKVYQLELEESKKVPKWDPRVSPPWHENHPQTLHDRYCWAIWTKKMAVLNFEMSGGHFAWWLEELRTQSVKDGLTLSQFDEICKEVEGHINFRDLWLNDVKHGIRGIKLIVPRSCLN